VTAEPEPSSSADSHPDVVVDADGVPRPRGGYVSPREAGVATVVRVLVDASRPEQLLLMAVVYATGVALAVARGAGVDPASASLSFLVYLPVAASVHYANEYADRGTDLLADRTRFSGGSGALARTGLDPRVALWAAGATLGVGAAASLPAFAAGHLSGAGLALLVAIAALGWSYSLPPLALAWNGLGEVDNALLGGVLLPSYGVAASGALPPGAPLAFVPFGFVVFVNLLATTWPDRGPDAAVGKRTLATRVEPVTLRRLYLAGVAGAVGSLALAPATVLPPTVRLTVGASLLPLAWGYRAYTRRRSAFPTVAAMVATAVLQLVAWSAVAAGVTA
jgi:1,4-dihydroxy-2-naphthoate octaprenyltransferase